MASGELTKVGIRRLVFAALAAAVVLVGTIGPARASNDPLFAQQWGLAQIGAPAAWAASRGAGVTIGIVDTGVFLSHEDLAGKVVASTNCIGSGGDPGACTGSAQDDNGHGTHVSGIAAAYMDNGRGVAGVAPDARLVVAKALGSDGSGNSSDVVAGIAWVVQHGAKVVNLSLGESGLTATLFTDNGFRDAVNAAWAAGAVPVVASGNDKFLIFGGSANYGSLNALVVGATGPNGQPADYSSNIGSAKWGIMAPGGAGTGQPNDVVSAIWDKDHPSATNTYAYEAGTSMATPHVSGTVALLLARGLGRDAAVDRILKNAAPIPGCGPATCGSGRLNTAAAVGPPGPGGGAGNSSTGGGGGAAPSASAPRVIKPAAGTTVKPGTTTAQPPGSTTTVTPASAAELPPGDNPVVAAGQPKGDVKANSGRSSSRAGQAALAIGLLGATGLGSAFAVRRLRAGAAP